MPASDQAKADSQAGAHLPGPLAGVRVLDLTSMVSGPLATAILGDQGADVIKLEMPGTGDLIRQIGAARGGVSALFLALNRNKRSIALNLKEERGRELLLELVRTADVFAQNFRPGVAERMGIGEAELRGVRSDLIYVSISGFGDAGPYAQHRVYDVVIQALSGMAASQGDPRTGRPEPVRNIACDKLTAVHAAQAICAALFARERGAGGQHVRLSMLDASIAYLWPDVMQAQTLPGGGASEPASLSDILSAYETRDGFITVLAISDSEFQGLCRALGRPELAGDPRFASVAARMQHADGLGEIVRGITRGRRARDLVERLQAEGVPAASVNTPESVLADPQVIESGLLVERDHPQCGRVRIPRGVASFGPGAPEIGRLAPLLGEHTDEVLAELGLGDAELDELRAKGVAG